MEFSVSTVYAHFTHDHRFFLEAARTEDPKPEHHKGTIEGSLIPDADQAQFHFQHHKGTIEGRSTMRRVAGSAFFQHHRGTIEGCNVSLLWAAESTLSTPQGYD